MPVFPSPSTIRSQQCCFHVQQKEYQVQINLCQAQHTGFSLENWIPKLPKTKISSSTINWTPTVTLRENLHVWNIIFRCSSPSSARAFSDADFYTWLGNVCVFVRVANVAFTAATSSHLVEVEGTRVPPTWINSSVHPSLPYFDRGALAFTVIRKNTPAQQHLFPLFSARTSRTLPTITDIELFVGIAQAMNFPVSTLSCGPAGGVGAAPATRGDSLDAPPQAPTLASSLAPPTPSPNPTPPVPSG